MRGGPYSSTIDVYWLPLGAGGHSVRWNGRVYEAIIARMQRRERRDLYHAALEVRRGADRYVVELAPVRDAGGSARGVVAEGAVGARWARRFRAFRYELRCWQDGIIPDLDEAVGGPIRVARSEAAVHRILEAAPALPDLVWGRDELGVHDMWNSNSAISWLLERAGVDAAAVPLPAGGRAPGWDAGIRAARDGTAVRQRHLR